MSLDIIDLVMKRTYYCLPLHSIHYYHYHYHYLFVDKPTSSVEILPHVLVINFLHLDIALVHHGVGEQRLLQCMYLLFNKIP